MKIRLQVVVIAVSLAIAAVAEPPLTPFGDTAERISIMTTTAWNLHIGRDGSGRIGFAASAQPRTFAPFEKGTFDFTNVLAIVSQVASTSETDLVTVDVAVFHLGQTEAKSTRLNLKRVAVVALYATGFDKAKLEGTLVEEHRKRWPPFPHNQPSGRTRSTAPLALK